MGLFDFLVELLTGKRPDPPRRSSSDLPVGGVVRQPPVIKPPASVRPNQPLQAAPPSTMMPGSPADVPTVLAPGAPRPGPLPPGPKPKTLNLDASQFTPLTNAEAKAEAQKLSGNRWGVWFGR